MTGIGVGIIGCGNISTDYINLMPLFSGVKLRAVADINPAAAKAQAGAHEGIIDLSVEALLAANDVDIIVNLTIPAAHYDVSHAILSAGKNAYSEKPLVLELDQAKRLSDLAAQKGLRVGSAPDTFLGGAHQRARAAIDAGDIGRVVAGTCHVMSYGMEHWHPNPDFFFKPGGGPILDLGPYYITNLVQMLGPVHAVTAMTNSSFDTRTIQNGDRLGEEITVETPTNIHAILQFESGALVTLGASWDVRAHRHKEMELYGESASLYVPDPNFFGGTVQRADSDGNIRELDLGDHPFGVPNRTDNQENPRANYRCAGLADMAQAISGGRMHRCNMDLAVHVVDVMTSILKAGDEKAWIKMTTTCSRPDALSAEEARGLLA